MCLCHIRVFSVIMKRFGFSLPEIVLDLVCRDYLCHCTMCLSYSGVLGNLKMCTLTCFEFSLCI